jgi:hypothetical protein
VRTTHASIQSIQVTSAVVQSTQVTSAVVQVTSASHTTIFQVGMVLCHNFSVKFSCDNSPSLLFEVTWMKFSDLKLNALIALKI